MRFIYKDTCLVQLDTQENQLQKLENYAKHLAEITKLKDYSKNESSIVLPVDTTIVTEVKRLLNIVNAEALELVVVVGIGGSSLGTKAIYDALGKKSVELIFLETIDPVLMNKTLEKIKKLKNPNKFLINVISKSGKTIETLTNAQILHTNLENNSSRFVVTTEKDSPLWRLAMQNSMKTLEIPAKVGGRFSVFSGVGLFPLACAGYDVEKLLNGASLADHAEAVISAHIHKQNIEASRNINCTFFTSPELENLGKWYQQLMAESLGKDEKGITPIVNIMSNDFHSVLQLYIGGPKDKYFNFVTVKNVDNKFIIKKGVFADISGVLENKSEVQILEAIQKSVLDEFANNNIPFTVNELSELSEKELGIFMQFKMLEIMYLGKLMDVNVFNQPNVEKYKETTRERLSQN